MSINVRMPFVLLLGLWLTLSACGDLWKPDSTAQVTLRVPKKDASLRPAAEAVGPEYVRVSVRGPGMATLHKNALAGESLVLEVPAGEGRVFSAEIFSDEARQKKTYGGESGAVTLSPGQPAIVVIEVRRIEQNEPPSLAEAKIQEGQYFKTSILRVTPLGWADPDGDQPRYRFTWLVNGSEVAGASGDTLGGEHFKKGDRVACRVLPVDDQAEGLPVVSNEVAILNSAPELEVAILPGPYFFTSSIYPSIKSGDADGDSVVLTSWKWTIGGVPTPTETSFLPAYRAAKGQTVVLSITVTDGFSLPVTVSSNPVVIQNSPPQVSTKALSNYAPREADTVSLNFEWFDADGDEIAPAYQWYVNGTPVFGATAQSITGSDFDRGDSITVTFELFDGTETFYFEAGTATAINTPPSAAAAVISDGPFYEASILSAAATGWTDDDGDLPWYEIAWKVDGIAVSNAPTLDGSYFNKGNSVVAEFTPYDGFEFGAVITSPAVSIDNSRPAVTSLFWSAASFPLFTTNDAVYTATTFDDDGDAVTTATEWTLNGVVLAGESGDRLAHGYFVKGDVIAVTVTPYDGSESGSPQTETITVLNSRPSAPVVTIVPVGGLHLLEGEGGELQWRVDTPSDDPDGDEVTYQGDWYRNGIYVVTSPGMMTWEMAQQYSIGFVAGDEWYVHVTANDGTGLGGESMQAASNKIIVSGAAAQVAVGDRSTCLVTANHALFCTGSGLTGQPEVTHSLMPALVPNFANDVAQVAVGRDHACAVTLAGEIKCWGTNFAGQLGNGTTGHEYVPVSALGITDAVQVAAGNDHTCGRTSTGALYCWGEGFAGKLGVGDTLNRNLPQLVSFGEPVSWVSAGGHQSCAVGVSGQAKCWGSASYGQIGDGGYSSSTVPVAVAGLTNALKIETATYHTCALLITGGVACWGSGGDGQIGTLNGAGQNTPYAVAGLEGTALDIGVGDTHSCAVMDDGSIYCWGRNAAGALGTGDTSFIFGPRLAAPLGTHTQPHSIAAGGDSTCIITQGKGLLCWGSNKGGKLGNGATHDAVAPNYTTITGATGVAAGSYHVCTTGVDVMCWGYNTYGQFGTGTWEHAKWEPVIAGPGSGAPVDVRAGGFNTCTIRDDASMWCAGNNLEGQTGNGIVGGGHVHTATRVIGLDEGVVDATVAGDFACAITIGAGLKCWGKNNLGQLGLGASGASVTYPTEVPIGVPIVSVAGGRGHACAIDATGALWCWGANDMGQLGDGTTTSRPTPAVVPGISNLTKVVAAPFATCALDSGNNVYCWGDSVTSGQGLGGSVKTPWLLAGFKAIDIGLGNQHACLLSTANEVYCWGSNSRGELGLPEGDFVPQLPVPLAVPVSAISLGSSFTCAIDFAQNVVCWGDNTFGQINDRSTWLPNGMIGFYDDTGELSRP